MYGKKEKSGASKITHFIQMVIITEKEGEIVIISKSSKHLNHAFVLVGPHKIEMHSAIYDRKKSGKNEKEKINDEKNHDHKL